MIQVVRSIELSESAPSTFIAPVKIPKNAIRTSLRASTIDGVFATIFSNITAGVLLTNFLIDLGATPTEIGVLASVPMLANLVQPIGAHLSEKTTSRHLFCGWIYGVSRSMWLILAVVLFLLDRNPVNQHTLVIITLSVASFSGVLGAFGSAPWLSWMAALVPSRLRGRYFGFRNSAANLTNLISIPLMGWAISHWLGGAIQGYGLMLILGIAAGLISLTCQNFITDINPQEQRSSLSLTPHPSSPHPPIPSSSLWQHSNFLMFLLYFTLWMFAVNLSAPFFNLYLLDDLKLDISLVTLYNSLSPAANLLMLVLWGKLADRFGNRAILLSVGVGVAITPMLWLITGMNPVSVWLWLPLLHLLGGGTWAAIDLCSTNLQIGIVPTQKQSTYFGIVAATGGVSSAVGTLAGGFLVQYWDYSGLLGLFFLSTILRLVALLPLVFVSEKPCASGWSSWLRSPRPC
ncbi:MAG: MFS transporter [Cyanobacteria bacterium CRU_2_1]|nr:MFS transporter [Cyanobacteria bacterium RU_5_0]NJR57638.1 MFS transporter [Cyanobacteria bacterium CRU_2_1]